jgi:hypothetical protein
MAEKTGIRPASEPGRGQTSEQIEAWVRQSAAPGTIVVVMQWQRMVREYFLDQVASLNLDRRRVTLLRHGRFNLEGRGMDAPRNALTLCVPTADLLDAAATGRTWLDGKLAFARQLSLPERHLAGLIRIPKRDRR